MYMNTKDIIQYLTNHAMHIDCSQSSAVAEAAIFYRGSLMVSYRSNPGQLYWFDLDVEEIMDTLRHNLDSVGRFVAEVKAKAPKPTVTKDWAMA